MKRLIKRLVMKFRRVAYKCGFRPKAGNPLHSPSLAIKYGWSDWSKSLTKSASNEVRLDSGKLVDMVSTQRQYARQVPLWEQTFFIFPHQIQTLVNIDKEGRSYDEWVEMLQRHGWTVVDPQNG